MKKFIIIYLLSIISLFSFSAGIGDLNINISLVPEIPTKKYYVNNSVLLDVGDINTNNLSSTIEKKIAVVNVTMKTGNNKASDDSGDDYCVIGGGDFTDKYKINNLRNLGGEIKTDGLMKYYGGKGVKVTLFQKNFSIISQDTVTNNSSDETYGFSAYPDKCMSISGGKDRNIIKNLSYSFEIWIRVTGAKSGDIVRADVTVGSNNNPNEEAAGALKDLVQQHFSEISK